MRIPNIVGLDEALDRALDKLDNVVSEDGIKVAVQPDTSKLDPIVWAKANPWPAAAGAVFGLLILRKLL